jgi:ribonuclease HI
MNVDGYAIGLPSCGAIGGVFRNWQSCFVGGFSQNIGHATSFEAELCAVMFAIEKSVEMNWKDIWMESDSLHVVKAFTSSSHVPWRLRTRWNNCMYLAQQINCSCTHIFRESNSAAHSLASNGQSLACFTSQWWNSPPSFILHILTRDSVGLPFSRFLM